MICDTSVLVSSLVSDLKNHEASLDCFLRCTKKPHAGICSSYALAECYSTLTSLPLKSRNRQVRFDLERLEIRGEEQALLKGLFQFWGLVAWSFARNGDLVYMPELFESKRVALEWIDRDGNRSPALPLGTYDWFKISPDGDWLIYGDEIGRIRIVNLETRVSKALRGEPQGVFPVWGPKGEWVMWSGKAGEGITNIHEAHTSLYLNRLGDGAEAERLILGDQLQIPLSWSRDGRHVLFFTNAEETDGDLLVLDMARTTEMNGRAGDISEFQVRPGYQD